MDDFLQELKRIKRVDPDPTLMDKTWAQIQRTTKAEDTLMVSLRTIRLAAASVALLIGLNAWAFAQQIDSGERLAAEQGIADEVEQVFTDFSLYE